MASNKTKNKKLVSYSIDTNLVEHFNKYCEINSINKSLFIENYIKTFIKIKK